MKRALLVSLCVVSLLLVIGAGYLVFVVPAQNEDAESSQVAISAISQAVFDVSSFIRTFWVVIPLVLFVLVTLCLLLLMSMQDRPSKRLRLYMTGSLAIVVFCLLGVSVQVSYQARDSFLREYLLSEAHTLAALNLEESGTNVLVMPQSHGKGTLTIVVTALNKESYNKAQGLIQGLEIPKGVKWEVQANGMPTVHYGTTK